MNLSLNALASIVINDTFAGLKAKTNIPLSRDQVKDEITTMRSRVMEEYIRAGSLNLEGLFVPINCIPVTCEDLGGCCEVPTGTNVLRARIPKIFDLLLGNKKAIRYVGSPNRMEPWNILTGTDYLYYGQNKWLKNKPAVWFDNASNAWIFNPPTDELEYLSITAIWDDPRELEAYSCACYNDDDAYPIPGWMADRITGKLTNDYIRFFRSGQQQPNTQSAQETPNVNGQA